MHSTTQYSLQDLHFDEVNLATINEVKQNCVRYAIQSKDSLDYFLSDIESFIGWALQFHEKKELIFHVNGGSLKYQKPILSHEGLCVREATEESLSELKSYLDILEDDIYYPAGDSKMISACVFNQFIVNFWADPKARNALSDKALVVSALRLGVPGSGIPAIFRKCPVELPNDEVIVERPSVLNQLARKSREEVAAAASLGRPANVTEAAATEPGLTNLEVIGGSEDKEFGVNEDSNTCKDNLDIYEYDTFADVQGVLSDF